MFICVHCEPDHPMGYGYSPSTCEAHTDMSPLARAYRRLCPSCLADRGESCEADGERRAHVGIMAFHPERVTGI